MPLLRVQAFLNTVDLEQGVDRLAERDSASDWLIDAGMVGPDRPVSAAELVAGREVRDCLRSLLGAAGDGASDDGGGVRAEDLETLRKLAAEHSARLTVADGGALGIECARGDTLGDGLF